MQYKRVKASIKCEALDCEFPCRVVLLQLKDNGCNFSTHIEIFPTGKRPYIAYGEYCQTKSGAITSFYNRLIYNRVEEDTSFTPDKVFSGEVGGGFNMKFRGGK